MSRFIDEFTSWMATNRLLLNPPKIQAIWLGDRRQLAKIDILRLSSLFPHIAFYLCARPRCPLLTFPHHINLVARKCYYQLRQLRMVSRSLTHQSTLTRVYAFVTIAVLTAAALCSLGSSLVPWSG